MLALSGELDLAALPELEAAVPDLTSGSGHLVFDLRELEFIDSAGMHVLLRSELQGRESDWQVTIVRGGPQVHRVFEVLRVADRLQVVDEPPAIT